jgi:hypothetical protein
MKVQLPILSRAAVQTCLDDICRVVTSLARSQGDAATTTVISGGGSYAPLSHVTDSGAHTSLFNAKSNTTHNHDTVYAAKGIGQILGLRLSGVSNDRWYPGAISGWPLTTLAITANRVYAYPLSISRSLTLDGLAIDISTYATGNWMSGIYEDDGGKPGDLLISTGSQVGAGGWCSATGLAQVLLADTVYWHAVVMDATATLRSYDSASMYPVFGWSGSGGKSQGSCYCYGTPGAFSMPDPFGSITFGTENTACPAVWSRFS